MMKEAGRFLMGVLGVLMLAAGTAYADRTMVVVLDASGSMQSIRADGKARFDVAKTRAHDRVFMAAMEVQGLAGGVAVYTFSGDGITARTSGFVDAFTAVTVIDNLQVTSDLTPLAGSLCDTIDIARTSGTGATTARLLEVWSDGGENNTNPMHACAGPFSTISTSAPFDTGSWQNRVYLRAVNSSPSVTISATLFTDVANAFARTMKADPEQAALAKAGMTSVSAAASALSDADFYAALAADTGGDFSVLSDATPVPVSADVDGDFDVDRDDAIKLARRFGAPPIRTFDLNNDGVIGYPDYAILLTRFGTGTGSPVPDRYTTAGTIYCAGSNNQVVIDGKAIENAGVTIEAHDTCVITIRNSLIVSGKSALKVKGSARLIIDDSIIVGGGAWLTSTGNVKLSAANTVFHGVQQVTGNIAYTDRGGNVFEQ